MLIQSQNECGSTGVAALQAGYRFIGIELDPAYAALARRRILRAARQSRVLAR